MNYDKTQSLDAFLSATAAKQPTPGGGSVTALVGALAAAMGEMVVSYSIGKKDLAPHQEALTAAMKELNHARQIMLELMVEDQAAYETLSTTRKLPQTDPRRAEQFDAALLLCIRIPQEIAATAAAVLGVCDRLVDRSNKYLLSDLAVCAELTMATIRCAAYNVRVNLGEVNSSERYQIESAISQQIADSSKVIQRVIPRIWAHLKGP